MKSKFSSWLVSKKYYFLIVLTVLIFFFQVFKSQVPFPGDLLADENPYNVNSYFGIAPGGYPNKAQGPDVIKEIYPWRFFSVESLKNGQIPFWNPYNFSGNPQMANFQTGIFYPLNLFYFILPFSVAWTLLIMLQPILGGIFMYLFLSKGLKLSAFSSFLGGIAFAFSSYMTVWIEYGNIGNTLLWLPLILLLTKRFSEKITAVNFFSLAIFSTFSLLAGYIQGVFYIYIFSGIYFLYLLKFKKENLKKFLLFLVTLILPLLLGAFQILPTLMLFSSSTRGHYSLEQISNLLLPFNYWITIFAPDFFGNPATRNYYLNGTYIERVMYVGVSILFFSFYSLKSKIKENKFFAIAALISLVVATNLPLVKYFYLIPLPLVSTTVPTRELSLFIFSSIILASLGVNHWEKNKAKTNFQYLFIAIYLIVWISILLLYKLNISDGEQFKITVRNFVLPSILALATVFIFNLRNNLGKVLLTVIVLVDFFYFFQKITPFSSSQLIYPQTSVVSYLQKNAGINRFWGYGSAYISPNFQTFDKTYSPEGNDPLHIATYGKLLASSGMGKLPEILPRPDANIASGFGQEDLKNNFYRKRILDLLGVKYILHKSDHLDLDTFPKDSYNMIWNDNVWQIYENKNVLPRFFMANDYLVLKNQNDVIKNIYDKNIDLSKILLLAENPSLAIDKNSQNSIKLISYNPNKVSFETNSTGNSLVFLSDNYYPEWKAYIDGKEAKILLADYSFRAVTLPKGSHKLEFNYNAQKFNDGIKISIVALIVLGLSTILIKRYEKK